MSRRSTAYIALVLLVIACMSLSCRAMSGQEQEAPAPAETDERSQIDDAFSPIDGEDLGPWPSAGCDGGAAVEIGSTEQRQLEHDGLLRDARVYVADSYDGDEAMPLVFVLHGGGGSAEQIETQSAEFNPIADREGFVVVYANGVESDGLMSARTWNGGGCCGYAAEENIDDVGFLMALLDDVTDDLCIDERRVYSTGMSNGAIMSYRLACEQADRIAAIAPVAATQFAENCQPARPVPLLHVHGTEDQNAPYDGGEGCGFAGVPFPSVTESLDEWGEHNQCAGQDDELLSLGDGQCDLLGQCDAPVIRCRIDGGKHSWPGGHPPAINRRRCQGGHHSTSFYASEVIWRFFAGQAIP